MSCLKGACLGFGPFGRWHCTNDNPGVSCSYSLNSFPCSPGPFVPAQIMRMKTHRNPRTKMSNYCPLCAKILSPNMRQVRFGRRCSWASLVLVTSRQKASKLEKGRKLENVRELDSRTGVGGGRGGPCSLLPRLSQVLGEIEEDECSGRGIPCLAFGLESSCARM